VRQRPGTLNFSDYFIIRMYNQNQAVKPQSFVKTIIIIHLALFMGQVVFAAVVLFIAKQPVVNFKPGADPLFYMAPVLVLFGMAAGSFLFKQLRSKAAERESLTAKLSAYQAALIIRYALSEGPSLFCIVCMMITNNGYYLVIAGINILYFIMIRPSRTKIQDDLNLTYQEKAEMDPQ